MLFGCREPGEPDKIATNADVGMLLEELLHEAGPSVYGGILLVDEQLFLAQLALVLGQDVDFGRFFARFEANVSLNELNQAAIDFQVPHLVILQNKVNQPSPLRIY